MKQINGGYRDPFSQVTATAHDAIVGYVKDLDRLWDMLLPVFHAVGRSSRAWQRRPAEMAIDRIVRDEIDS